MFYLIEIDSGDGDPETASVVGRIVDDGDVQISSPHWNLPVKVVGKATWTDVARLPGNIRVAIVEPLA